MKKVLNSQKSCPKKTITKNEARASQEKSADTIERYARPRGAGKHL